MVVLRHHCESESVEELVKNTGLGSFHSRLKSSQSAFYTSIPSVLLGSDILENLQNSYSTSRQLIINFKYVLLKPE